MQTQFESDRKFDGNKLGEISPKNLMPKKCTYKLRTVWPRRKSIEKRAVFIIFQFSHDAMPFSKCTGYVFKIYRFEDLPA